MLIIRQKEYNIEEQREFAKLPRIAIKYIGRARKGLARRFDRSMARDIEKNRQILRRNYDVIFDAEKDQSKLRNVVDAYQKKHGLKTSITSSNELGAGGPVSLTSQSMAGVNKSTADYLKPFIKNGDKNLVVLPENMTNYGTAGHELGHIANSMGANGKLRKLIHSKVLGYDKGYVIQFPSMVVHPESSLRSASERAKILKDTTDPNIAETIKSMNRVVGQTGVKQSAKNLITGLGRLSEEKSASKYSLKHFLPEIGYKAKDYKGALKTAYSTYPPLVKTAVKLPLRNLVQIPSRRGDFGEDVYRTLRK